MIAWIVRGRAPVLVFVLTAGLLYWVYAMGELPPPEVPVSKSLVMAGFVTGVIVIPLLVGILVRSLWIGVLPPLAYLFAWILASVTVGGGLRDVTYDLGLWGSLLLLGAYGGTMAVAFLGGRGVRLVVLRFAWPTR